MKEIKVLVSCCSCNQKFAALVESVVKKHQIEATVEKIDDITEVMKYNVMTTPALVINGKVVAKGNKSEEEILEILQNN